MKKTLSVILTLVMLVMLLPVNIIAAPFKDVSDSAYYAIAAQTLSEKKILEGYPDGTFGPQRLITRAEMSAIVCRMINIELKTQNLKSPFTDVADNHWAIPYISAASEAKIINGDGDGTFRPEDNVRHEEAIKMVVCALNMVPQDIETDPVDWSAPYLKIAEEKGVSANLIGKKGDKSTRGDVAVMVYNGIVKKVNPPKASVGSGTYTSSQRVTLTSDIAGAKIYYTLNGSTPTSKNVEYTSPITINRDRTLKAVAVYDGVTSDVLTVTYQINISTGSGGHKDRYDFEGTEKPGNNNNNDDDDDDDSSGNDNVQTGPSEEEKAASDAICAELTLTLDALENISFNGKAAEIMEYLKADINEEVDLAASDESYIVTNDGVRIKYAADIATVRSIIESMTDEEKDEFKQEILKIDSYSLMTIKNFFEINIDYFE